MLPNQRGQKWLYALCPTGSLPVDLAASLDSPVKPGNDGPGWRNDDGG